MFRTIAIAVLAISTASAASAATSDFDAVPTTTIEASMTAPIPVTIATPEFVARPSHGIALSAMYVSYVGLQLSDALTTSSALKRGAVEANPIMAGIAGQAAALWAVKGAAAFGTIYMAERLWKQNHRAQAIALMAVSNSVMAVVVAHNTAVTRSLR
jgi:hypothetical protein